MARRLRLGVALLAVAAIMAAGLALTGAFRAPVVIAAPTGSVVPAAARAAGTIGQRSFYQGTPAPARPGIRLSF